VAVYLFSTETAKHVCLSLGFLMVAIPFILKDHKSLGIIGVVLFIIGLLNSYFKVKVLESEIEYQQFLRKEKWKKDIKR
jgi:hypothetical protein